jgi:hypothetical protein
MKSSGIDEDRSSFKRKVFTETFFGKRMNNIFVDQYPTIASVLMSVKKTRLQTCINDDATC